MEVVVGGIVGVIYEKAITGKVMGMLVNPDRTAEILALPAALPVAIPVEVMVTIFGSELIQVT